MDTLHVIFLSLIEGVTEFLPISSTGHLILFSETLGILENPFVQSFNIIIQIGAIAAVLVLYWRRFLPIHKEFYLKLGISFFPAALIGFLLQKPLTQLLDSVFTVALSLILGGLALIYFDRRKSEGKGSIQTLTWGQALGIGIAQSLALIPGVSRAGAAIIGGLLCGLDRKNATEYSFFLGVPTLAAASIYKFVKNIDQFSLDQVSTLILGTALSFIFAIGGIKFLITMVSRYGLYHFGWYRIVLGSVILASLLWGL